MLCICMPPLHSGLGSKQNVALFASMVLKNKFLTTIMLILAFEVIEPFF